MSICATQEPTTKDYSRSHLLDDWTDESTISQTRSLDPLTPIAEDLLKTIADVALERATSTGAELIRDGLHNALCEWLTEDKLWLAYSSRPELAALLRDFAPKSFPTPLLPRTCNAVKGVRIQELAASSVLMEHALGVDLTNIAFRLMDSLFVKPDNSKSKSELAPILDGVHQIILSLLEGRAVSSERDVQLLLLRLGDVGFPIPPKAEDNWRFGLEMGMSVLVQCVRQGTCTADRLSRALDDEIAALQGHHEYKDYLEAVQSWSGLRSILARSVDVLKPPPGVSPRATAKAAFNIIFDVLDHRATVAKDAALTGARPYLVQVAMELLQAKRAPDQSGQECQGSVSECVRSPSTNPALGATWQAAQKADLLRVGRILTNAILDENLSEAVIESSSFLTNLLDQAYTAACTDPTEEGCPKVPLTTAQLNKTFKLVGAMVSYASTYAGDKTDGHGSDADVAKQRSEERKKAMDEFIEAATDRSNRGGEPIFSAGVAVAMSAAWSKVRSSAPTQRTFLEPGLSLPLGAALQVLPGDCHVGFHLQAEFLDLGQYVAVKSGSSLDRSIGTALFFGGTLGVLVGTSKASALLGFEGGYAPGLTWSTSTPATAQSPGYSSSTTNTQGVWRFGFVLGTYVPFFDFN